MTAGSLSIHATLTSPLSLRLGTSLCVLACAQVLFLVVRDSSTLTCNFDLSPGRYWRPSPCLASTCTQVCSLGYVCAVQLTVPLGCACTSPCDSLSQYRGAAPLEHTLLNGDDVSGVSIIELHPARFDAGRILWQQEHPVAPTTTYPECVTFCFRGPRAVLSMPTYQRCRLQTRAAAGPTRSGCDC